ncbi:hypothetical protein, partial [Stenotrophomonas maltophilia]
RYESRAWRPLRTKPSVGVDLGRHAFTVPTKVGCYQSRAWRPLRAKPPAGVDLGRHAFTVPTEVGR